MPRVSSCVLDASALLAVIGCETGWERVVEHLPNALICSVNLSEVAAKLAEREGLTIDDIHLRLSQYELRVIPFDERLAYAAAALRPQDSTSGPLPRRPRLPRHRSGLRPPSPDR